MKSVQCLVLSLLALIAPCSYGQMEDDAVSSEVLAHASDGFVLTTAAPAASRPIVIDRIPRVVIVVSALGQELDLTLVGPKNGRYTFGKDRPGFESSTNVVEQLGANFRAVLTDPEPGTWTLEARAKNITQNLPVVVNVYLQGEVFTALTAGEIEHRVGDFAALSLATFEGTVRLRGATVSATMLHPDRTTTSVRFRDDGGEADFEANDGIHTALVELPNEGDYEVKASARGVASTGGFLRTATARLAARRATAQLGGTFIETSTDDNEDGLLDTVTIAPAVNVTEAASYLVSVRLRSASGKTLQRTSTLDLTTGTANPQVHFEGREMVAQLGEDGPYAVSLVRLDRQVPHDVVFVDSRTDMGNTRAHRIVDLQRDQLRIIKPAVVTGIDANHNGQFEQLRFDVQVETEVSGSYAFEGSLADISSTLLGESLVNSVSLNAGVSSRAFFFDGLPIGRNGVDGPFILTLKVNGPSPSLYADEALLTEALSASKFEGYSPEPDTTPPTIAVAVTPEKLWPPNHEMIEITPTISIGDDRDLAPVATLESITLSEANTQLGDDKTSPDINIENDRIFLRAERSGVSGDRVYKLTWRVRDRSGNAAEAVAVVTVPHDGVK